mgnify:CR=1 FL=1
MGIGRKAKRIEAQINAPKDEVVETEATEEQAPASTPAPAKVEAPKSTPSKPKAKAPTRKVAARPTKKAA